MERNLINMSMERMHNYAGLPSEFKLNSAEGADDRPRARNTKHIPI